MKLLPTKEATLMKKMICLLAAIYVLALASIAHAGERAGAFSISPYIGGYMYDEDQPLRKHRPVYGLRLGYDWTDHFGTELVGNFVRAQYKGADNHLGVLNYRLDLLYNFMPESTVVPYLAAGGGGETIRYYKIDGGHSSDGTFNFGGGVKFFVNDDVALRADMRHILDITGQDRTYHNWEYSVGIGFLFGGAKPAVEVAPAPAPPVAPPAPIAEPTHYKYCVTLHIEFDIDRDIIRPEYRDEVAKVGDFMKKYPTTSAVIEGHTDNVGSAEHNMDLSQRRAQSVVNYLVENFGIDRSRLTAKGYGFTRPIADNATNEGKQKNRRIEAIIDCAFDVQKIPPPERLCISLLINFDSGKADVKPEFRGEIAKVADYMKQNPTTTAVIEGHTDNVGDTDANMKLSQQRAENVVNYLVDNFGIDRARLSAKGYGSTRRISYNDTPEGRAMNRRIDAVIDCVIKK
jgi:OmpA-OmpF porin, OOP family